MGKFRGITGRVIFFPVLKFIVILVVLYRHFGKKKKKRNYMIMDHIKYVSSYVTVSIPICCLSFSLSLSQTG